MAKDIFHDAVVTALQNEGWTITHDPYYLSPEKGIDFEIDLGAERIILGAERNNEKIAVEIKSFIGNSTTYEFHLAIGQFIDYYLALKDKEPDRILFLAVPELTYRNYFAKDFIQKALTFVNAKVIIYDAVNKTIVEWKK